MAPAHVFRGESTGASFGPPTSAPAAIAHVSHTQVMTTGMTARATDPRGCASTCGPCRIATRNASSAEAYRGPNEVTATAMRTSRLRDMSGRDPAEPPVPPLIVEDGLEQVTPRDVGPEDRRDVQLGVGELPQQEIGEPAFTGRPDQQVRVAPGRRVELGANGVLVDVLESLDALEHLFGKQARRPGQLSARGVGDAQIERQSRAVARLPLDALHCRPGAGGEPSAVAQHVDRDPLVLELRVLPRNVLLEQLHQRRDLGRGTLPEEYIAREVAEL